MTMVLELVPLVSLAIVTYLLVPTMMFDRSAKYHADSAVLSGEIAGRYIPRTPQPDVDELRVLRAAAKTRAELWGHRAETLLFVTPLRALAYRVRSAARGRTSAPSARRPSRGGDAR